MKINCIIDTCSCICLSNSDYNQSSLLAHFADKVNINYSNEIHAELRDHRDKQLPTFIFDSRLRVSTIKFTMNDYEKRMLGKAIPSRQQKGNKGEIDNFLLAVDQLHHIKKASLVYLTDDKKAINGHLAEWLDTFPAINVWTSYEVVLFLYSESVIPSKEIAIEKIQDIISFTAPPPTERSQKTAQELIAVKRKYSQKIDRISSLLK